MNTFNVAFFPLAAISLIATGAFSPPASADIEVVAVLATQTRLADRAELFELDANKQQLAVDFKSHMNTELGERLADEFESGKRSALLASEFSEQILDALDKRLPDEVNNLISAVK